MRFSMDVLPRQPFTCAHPVMPHFTLWRNMYRGMRPFLLDEARPLRARPYQGHVALEHVQELRQLVDAEPSHKPSHRCPPRIVRDRPNRPGIPLRIPVPRSGLEDDERLSVEPHALLLVEHRTFRGELDEKRDDGEGDRQEQEK